MKQELEYDIDIGISILHNIDIDGYFCNKKYKII